MVDVSFLPGGGRKIPEKGFFMKKTIFSRLIKSSTLAFYREGRRTRGYSFWHWIHGYIYARWPYLYIRIGTGELPLLKWVRPIFMKLVYRFCLGGGKAKGSESPPNRLSRHFADTYHGKVVPLKEAENLVSIDCDVDIVNLEKVIPYSSARDIILRNPEHIVVLECPCRTARSHPCQPLDVCLIIGDPMAAFVEEHHPRKARRISCKEAIRILHDEHARGHVHHAFFKDAMLNRFYAICNCCSCCCGAVQAHRCGTPMLASSGFVAAVDDPVCQKCGHCVTVCVFDAIQLDDDGLKICSETCMGCGVCVDQCTSGALSLRSAPERGQPLEIMKLLEKNHVV